MHAIKGTKSKTMEQAIRCVIAANIWQQILLKLE